MEMINYMDPVVKDLKEIPENYQAYYKQDEASGNYVFQATEESTKAVLAGVISNQSAPPANVSPVRERELTKTNLALSTQVKEKDVLIEELNARANTAGIIDADTAAFLKSFAESEQVKQKKASGDYNAVEERTKLMRQQHEGQLTALNAKLNKQTVDAKKYEQLYNSGILEGNVTRAAQAVGNPAKGAMQDILNRARSSFKIEEDINNPGQKTLIPYNVETDTPLYGVDTTSYMTPEEWAAQLMKDVPYLWQESSGGGAKGSTGPATGDTKGSPNVIHKNDNAARLANMDHIISGKMRVVGVGD